jgi:hypothetical protein
MITDVVKFALENSLTDIGQITPEQRKELARAVHKGILVKGRGGRYPIVKTVYAAPGFDFVADREDGYRVFRLAAAVDDLMRAVRKAEGKSY